MSRCEIAPRRELSLPAVRARLLRRSARLHVGGRLARFGTRHVSGPSPRSFLHGREACRSSLPGSNRTGSLRGETVGGLALTGGLSPRRRLAPFATRHDQRTPRCAARAPRRGPPLPARAG